MPDQEKQPANTSDYQVVAICFRDQTINCLFADLLSSQGVIPNIISDPSKLPVQTKLITEACSMPYLSRDNWPNCLVVINDSTPMPANILTLSRPLTEAKVEAAINKLLAP